jgi:hypothetical protein
MFAPDFLANGKVNHQKVSSVISVTQTFDRVDERIVPETDLTCSTISPRAYGLPDAEHLKNCINRQPSDTSSASHRAQAPDEDLTVLHDSDDLDDGSIFEGLDNENDNAPQAKEAASDKILEIATKQATAKQVLISSAYKGVSPASVDILEGPTSVVVDKNTKKGIEDPVTSGKLHASLAAQHAFKCCSKSSQRLVIPEISDCDCFSDDDDDEDEDDMNHRTVLFHSDTASSFEGDTDTSSYSESNSDDSGDDMDESVDECDHMHSKAGCPKGFCSTCTSNTLQQIISTSDLMTPKHRIWPLLDKFNLLDLAEKAKFLSILLDLVRCYAKIPDTPIVTSERLIELRAILETMEDLPSLLGMSSNAKLNAALIEALIHMEQQLKRIDASMPRPRSHDGVEKLATQDQAGSRSSKKRSFAESGILATDDDDRADSLISNVEAAESTKKKMSEAGPAAKKTRLGSLKTLATGIILGGAMAFGALASLG